MTRFSFKGDVTHGFGDGPRNFAVMAENQRGLDAWSARLGNVVTDAMSVLQAAIAAPEGPVRSSAMETYFLTGPTPDGADEKTVKTMLVNTLNGLKSGRFAVKVHDRAAMTQANAAAYVSSRDTLERRPKKKHHTFRERDEIRQRTGAIHYAQAALETGGAYVIRVMIHEATHKFANTRDFSYYSVPEGIQLKPMTKAEALNNADSYAMYAMAVGYGAISPTVNW